MKLAPEQRLGRGDLTTPHHTTPHHAHHTAPHHTWGSKVSRPTDSTRSGTAATWAAKYRATTVAPAGVAAHDSSPFRRGAVGMAVVISVWMRPFVAAPTWEPHSRLEAASQENWRCRMVEGGVVGEGEEEAAAASKAMARSAERIMPLKTLCCGVPPNRTNGSSGSYSLPSVRQYAILLSVLKRY